eukprot:7103495-Pyramimonas_sp.AAC.1
MFERFRASRLFGFPIAQDGPRGLQDSSKTAREAPKRAPNRPKMTPRSPKRLPREPQDGPKTFQEGTKIPSALWAQVVSRVSFPYLLPFPAREVYLLSLIHISEPTRPEPI